MIVESLQKVCLASAALTFLASLFNFSPSSYSLILLYDLYVLLKMDKASVKPVGDDKKHNL